ncbi:MAG: hypothetical protein HYS23_03735 [Geobacter sp.]|nr:hypothetical protein [Geobacter sp.]
MRMVPAFAFILVFCCVGFCVAGPALARDADGLVAVETEDAETGAPQAEVGTAEVYEVQDEEALIEEIEAGKPVAAENKIQIAPGYRFLHVTGNGNRAAEYTYLHSGVAGSALFSSIGPELKVNLDGFYLNENDYLGDLLFDYRGRYRMQLRTEALFHNLDHETLFTPFFYAPWFTNYVPQDTSSGERYSLRTEQDLVKLRLMPWEYPLHLNFGFWRMTRDGTRQLIYDFIDTVAGTDTIRSISREVKRETLEGTAGLDVHLGYVDLCYSFNIRDFANRANNPRDNQEHNVDPDSRLLSHTIKLHTSMTGGLVGAFSYTHSTRESINELKDVSLNTRPENRLQNIAGEIVYTPRTWFSMAARFRHQEIDSDNVTVVSSQYPAIIAKPQVDSQKEIARVTLSLRPHRLLTLKGEYRGEFVHRDNTGYWPDLPEHTDIHRGSLTLLGRLKNGFRSKVRYEYATVSNPAYGNFYTDRHDGQLLLTYTSKNRWGVAANYRITQERNDEFSPATVSSRPALTRDREVNNASVTAWISPIDKITLTGTYGFLRSQADQEVLFTSGATSRTTTDFTSQAQLYSVGLSYRCTDRFDLALLFQQVHSFARFAPESNPSLDIANIREQSQSRTIETSASARAGYFLTRDFNCSLEYGYKRYNEKNSQFFDGTVQTVTVMLTRKW